MKNIKPDFEDSLRPEYKRSDFGELVQGKFATAQVDLLELTGLLLTCIGEDEGIKFRFQSHGHDLADHLQGSWTYEVDNHNQVILRYWQSSQISLAENVSNPVAVTNAEERKELQAALANAVKNLKAKISQSTNTELPNG